MAPTPSPWPRLCRVFSGLFWMDSARVGWKERREEQEKGQEVARREGRVWRERAALPLLRAML